MSPELRILLEGTTLTQSQATTLMSAILHGDIGEPGIEALLTTLHHRPVAAQELAGFTAAMQSAATPLPLTSAERDTLVDTCGTGGDGSHTFNISTAAALLAAAAGVPVAKHGNRKVTSRCGSADILERLGIPIGHSPPQAAAALRAHNFAFLLATGHHPGMRAVAPVRRRLPFRTVFNLLGPMSNPAGARRQLLGVYSPQAVTQVAEALATRGTMLHALVVHGTAPQGNTTALQGSGNTPNGNGLDELSLSGPTLAAAVQGTTVTHFTVTPEDAGLSRSGAPLPGGGPEENEAILRAVFAGDPGPARDIVLLNAAAVFLVAGRVPSLREGAQLAAHTIDSGAVAALLIRLSATDPLSR